MEHMLIIGIALAFLYIGFITYFIVKNGSKGEGLLCEEMDMIKENINKEVFSKYQEYGIYKVTFIDKTKHTIVGVLGIILKNYPVISYKKII